MFFGKLFRTILLFIILAEILSFCGQLYSEINTLVFLLIIFFTLILSLEKLEYGLYILLAELFIGSKGYLFSLETGGEKFSIRIALFLVIMAVWFLGLMRSVMANSRSHCHPGAPHLLPSKTINPQFKDNLTQTYQIPNNHNKRCGAIGSRGYWLMTKPYWPLFAFILWGFLWGLIRGNSFDNLFFDFNGWLYFLLIFPLLSVMTRDADVVVGELKQSCGSSVIASPDVLVGAKQSREPGHASQKKEQELIIIKNIFQIFTACIVVLGLKTIFLLYAFSHQWLVGLPQLYSWVRDTGVGEITRMNGNFYRIFFQSHVYSLIGFFIFLSLLVYSKSRNMEHGTHNMEHVTHNKNSSLKMLRVMCYVLCVMSSLPVLISFSRSFWVGGLVGLGILFCWFGIKEIKNQKSRVKSQESNVKCQMSNVGWLNRYYEIQWVRILKLAGFLILLFALEIGFLWGLINIFKPTGPAIDFASMVEKRMTTSAEEAAGMSRINLLKPLFQEIAKHPIIGSGFGTTVTYHSTDPRALARDPEGRYTTYAFEWGYLDIWLKIGLAGLLAYLYLIWKIFQKGWRNVRCQMSNVRCQMSNVNCQMSIVNCQMLPFGMLLGLIALLITSIFSPYLNHPLGIGYIILCSVVFQVLHTNEFAGDTHE